MAIMLMPLGYNFCEKLISFPDQEKKIKSY